MLRVGRTLATDSSGTNRFIDQSLGWKWISWIHMIVNGVLWTLEILFLRETRGAKILARRANKLRQETGKKNIRAPVELETESVKDLLRTACTRSIILLVREPVVLAFGLWIACEFSAVLTAATPAPPPPPGGTDWRRC